MLAEPHSFNKPTFYLGLGSSLASNVLAAGAHERTPGNVTLLAMGASGFSSPGDRVCYKVQVGAPQDCDCVAALLRCTSSYVVASGFS